MPTFQDLQVGLAAKQNWVQPSQKKEKEFPVKGHLTEQAGHLDEANSQGDGPGAGVLVVLVLGVDALGEQHGRVLVLLVHQPTIQR